MRRRLIGDAASQAPGLTGLMTAPLIASPLSCPTDFDPVAVVGKLLNERQLSMNEFEVGNGGFVRGG